MADRVVLTIGEPGHSDLVLYELQNAAEHMGCTVREAAVLMIGMGLAAATLKGMFPRASPTGVGLDPDWRPPPGDMIDLEPAEGYGVLAGQRPPRAMRDEHGRVTVLGVLERHQGAAQDAPACVLPAGWRPAQTIFVRSDSRPPGFVGEWDHDRHDSLQRFDPDGCASSSCEGDPDYAIFGAVFST